MEKISRVTSKGQVTVPVAIRRALGIGPGDAVVFELRPSGEVAIRPLRRRRLSELAGVLASTRPYPGKDAVRAEVGRRLGEAVAREASALG